MVQGQSNDSHAALLQRWIDVLHRWEDKKSQYQIELDQTTDLDQKQALVQGIEACENVIQTSQGLIQALSDRNLSASAQFPTPEMLALESPPVSTASPTAASLPAQQPSTPQVFSDPVAAALTTLDPSISNLSISVSSATPSPDVQTPTLKSLLKIGLPLLILAAVGLVTFRPKNPCTLAPDGSYSNIGLAMRVKQVLQASNDAADAETVAVGQYGCTVILKGTVPSQAVQRRIIDLAQGVTLPSQAPLEQAKRALGQESEQIQPVSGVVSSQLTIKPSALP
ncbi:MAG: BON domain-containing protein [Thermosynechococcaceae cyanobacterium]